jgi:hypothetical protein
MEITKVDLSIHPIQHLAVKQLYSIQCSYCGKEIILSGRLLALRLKARYLPEKQSCPTGTTCHAKKQGEINQLRKLEGTCAHQGHHLTIEQKARYTQTMIARGRYRENSERRLGIPLRELYGDKGEEAIQKIREARRRQADPRLGKKHSLESRQLMSTKRMGKHLSHGITGDIKQWHNKLPQHFDSSLEYVVFCMMNIQGLFWEKNTTLRIPYMDDSGVVRWYIPDILIYSDGLYTQVIKVVEIKPQIYLDNPNSYFYKNVQTKAQVAKVYGIEHGWNYEFLTEKDVYRYLYDVKLVTKLYKTFYMIVRLTKEFLNGKPSLYSFYQENKSPHHPEVLLCYHNGG